MLQQSMGLDPDRCSLLTAVRPPDELNPRPKTKVIVKQPLLGFVLHIPKYIQFFDAFITKYTYFPPSSAVRSFQPGDLADRPVGRQAVSRSAPA